MLRVWAIAGSTALWSTAFAQEGGRTGASTSFRPGHNLTLVAAAQQSQWYVRSAGEVKDLEFETWEPGAKLRYTFHLNLVRKFGMVLGTGVGAWYQDSSHGGFRPGSSFMFPSIVLGFVQNFEAQTRAVFAGEYSATWYPWLSTRGVPDRSDPARPRETRVELAPIPDTFTAFAQVDHFTRRNTALTASAGWKIVSQSLLGKPSKSTLIGASDFRNKGFFVALGVTWTLGDELGR